MATQSTPSAKSTTKPHTNPTPTAPATETEPKPQPRAIPPVATQWRYPKSLSSLSQKQLDTLLPKPIDYMDDDSFTDPATEAELFKKENDVQRPATAWYHTLHLTPDKRQTTPNTATPLLTPLQEKTLFLRYNFARYRAEAIRQQIMVPPAPPAPPPQKIGDAPYTAYVSKPRALELLRWHGLATQLRELIAEYNLALVLAMTRRLPAQHVDIPDMICEGNLALLRAIDKFNVARGFKFSTYACRAILKSFSRSGEKHTRYRRLFPVEFEPDYERSNYASERAADQEFDCSDRVRHIFETNAADLSDLEITIIEHRFFFDQAPQSTTPTPGTVGPLSPKGPRRPTLQEVGKLVGLTKERVRQIQNNALLRMRRTLESEFLDGRTPTPQERAAQRDHFESQLELAS